MNKQLFFLSKSANWQLYRNEVLTKLAYEHGYDVEILTTGVIKEYLKPNPRLKYRIFKNIFRNNMKVSFFPGSLLYIMKNRPDVVLALNNSTQITEYIALLLCKIAGIRFVWWTHAYDHNSKLSSWSKKLKKLYVLFFLKRSNSVITFSEKGKKYLVDNGLKASKIFPALNTLDTDKLLSNKHNVAGGFERTRFLSEVFPNQIISDSTFILLFSGRLMKDKQVDQAIKALKILKDKKLDVNLIVVGDGVEYSNLKSLVSDLNLNNQVSFAGSVFEDDEITKYFLASNLFVMPGYIGLAIVHAFSFSLPVITQDIGIHSPEIQYLEHGENGFLIDKGDTEQMAAYIESLISNKELMKKMSTNSLKKIEQEANIHNMIKEMNRALTY